jgi:hypothetical protein
MMSEQHKEQLRKMNTALASLCDEFMADLLQYAIDDWPCAERISALLKPCPLCASNKITFARMRINAFTKYCVECRACGCMVRAHEISGIHAAVLNWERRA